MAWLIVALGAYLLLAIANLLDKFLVDSIVKNSQAYTFLVSSLGLVVIVAAPWLLIWPGWSWFLFNLLVGFIFSAALWALYESLKRGEAARVLVFIGGLTPIFSLIFSKIFFQETYSQTQLLGVGFLLLGVLVIGLLPQSSTYIKCFLLKLKIKQTKSNYKSLSVAFLSALAYSLYFISSKYAYNHQGFASVFIWSRIGAFVFVLFFLFHAQSRQAIKDLLFPAQKKYKLNISDVVSKLLGHRQPKPSKFLILINQGIGSIGFVLQNYAISLGPVALVNALQGFQYAFLIILSSILSFVAPHILQEDFFSKRVVIQKIIAVVLIGIGLYYLVTIK